MISITYDPVLGCTGWTFTGPKRDPLTKTEAAVMIKAWVNKSKKPSIQREPLEDKKGKKQRTLEFQKQANE